MSETILGGKYILEREIGRGGMGSIWVALDIVLRRRVALKLLSADPAVDPASKIRFEREALAIAQLNDPHVVQIYDYGTEGGSPYIAMELLVGEDVAARLMRKDTLSISEVSHLISGVARALSAAHAAGIIHRDLKPANIFLVSGDPDEIVKVLDFGIAALRPRAVTVDGPGAVTRTGAMLGTPAYMSPEQVRGRGVDHRSDLWALGVVAYQALTGILPFSPDSFGDLLIDICNTDPPLPSSLVPSLGPLVDRFFERALAKSPADRFQSAREMAAAFASLHSAAAGSRPTKILVIDDEPDVALLIKSRFRHQINKAVYEFVFASDGAEALLQLRRQPDIDVALTDINMPRMDGLTFLKHAGEVNPMVRVIMVSAYSDMASLRAAMSRGAVDFLAKPIDFAELALVVEKEAKRAKEVRGSLLSSIAESGAMRTLLTEGIMDKLLPVLRAADHLTVEVIEGTVAFVDVFGFRAIARGPDPSGALGAVNSIFEVVIPELTSRGGILDKFVGDAAMAVFRGRGHESRAVAACLAVMAELSRMADVSGPSSPYASGVSIGAASGALISGSIGSKSLGRHEHTVFGDVVAAAARLTKMAGKGQIFIDSSLFSAVRDEISFQEVTEGREPGAATAHGYTDIGGVYEVRGSAKAPDGSVDLKHVTTMDDQ